ncbi:MAG: 1-deoxy-D-xylulose-5-phosphate reductoisomerase, partial [Bacteroidales bacterium]|nr:1-deoxy-D-xylulose-5-phosphate reductoisomerase [Bacteroidales bacterium]
MEENKRRIAILGSTGSIGTQALDVVSHHPELFQVEMLSAGSNASLLIEQARKFNPNAVVICNKDKYAEVKKALDPLDIKVFAGVESAGDLAGGSNVDIVLAAMVGFSGLAPTISAMKKGKVIALANKETLVAAGSIITRLSREYNSPLIPVDSEHSAVFQCLQGERAQVEKVLLTASGGPFFNLPKEDFEKITVEQALNHPNWKMGNKVTIDSASMMNKGLEIMEAAWLFNIPADKIEVVVHPQSIIHSMVQFTDGGIKAQLGYPDMRVPIQYALSYPYRISLDTKRLSFAELGQLTFFAPDLEKFPCLRIAYESFKKGGNIPCAMNAANEVAVAAFLRGQIRFTQIPQIIEKTIEKCNFALKRSAWSCPCAFSNIFLKSKKSLTSFIFSHKSICFFRNSSIDLIVSLFL